MSEEMPGSRMSSMHRQQIDEKPAWKTAEEWAKINDAMSPEQHRELKEKQRTSEDKYRQEVRNREQKPTYGRIAGGGAFPRAAKQQAGVDIPQVREEPQAFTEYDRIRSLPTVLAPWNGLYGVNETGFRAWHILDKVKRLLADGVPGPTVRELIEHMESKP